MFQVSLSDPITGALSISTNADCSTLTLTDQSNYTTSADDGNELADFTDYRKIIITSQDGGRVVLSSIGDGDIVIAGASGGVTTFNVDITGMGNGVYDVSIYSVPTWDPAANYQANDDIVYYLGSFYKAIANSVGSNPVSTPADWTEIVEITDFTEKYAIQESLVIACNLIKCLDRITTAAFCEIDSDFCNAANLCKNKDFLNAMKLIILQYNLITAANQGKFDKARRIFNLVNKICNC